MTIVRAATLRETLGLKDTPPNGHAWHVLLLEGLPYRSLGCLAKVLHLKELALAEHLGLNVRTLAARKKAKHFHAAESDLMYAIARAYVRLAGFKSTESSVNWLLHPLPAMKDLKPIDFMKTRLGTEYVMNAIQQLRPHPRFSENKLALDDPPPEDEDREERPPF